jgi:peptide/nickel transport system ATP-binding protein
MTPLLDIRCLGVALPGPPTLRVLDGVSLSIAPGEILGVVGESGAGKSVTGAAVLGLLTPPLRQSGGEIWFDGTRIDTLPAAAMRRLRGAQIAMVFQDPLTALNPVFTVGQQLIQTIREHAPLGRAEARGRAVGLLAEVGISDPEARLDAYPHEFSGGMRQRVVIALALAGNPRLIIADEPTTALDVSIQAQIIALLRGLAQSRGVGVLLITHDMGVIAEAADRVAVFYAGRIAEIGAVADVLRTPRHPYTRGLVGAIPRIGAGLDVLPQIPGSMPRLDALPEGCAFNPRCPLADARCRAERPVPRPLGRVQVACFHAESPLS